ncbi:putative membrane protein [Ehrlichia ruminantium]|uniref:Putative membrane protein n=1 Tax=Ehrlichia ruminantium TaxID=779 RepID=A0A170U105_EHRRU|nr:hypothetical protein [Ehrlichia ruminantium]GAT77065.1 putative membrane protein [Ehrlichia ruminantium]GAT78115.1 putative membrane protein [Ehrlichia ruminantium]GAT79265.1 putative membrane protein [Ehrlichia ruminantium]
MLSICYNKITNSFTIVKIITFLIISVFPILLIPIIALYSVLNHIFDSNIFKQHFKSFSIKNLKAILTPKHVSYSIKTGLQTLIDIQNISIEINGYEIDINYIQTKFNEYINYRNMRNIPRRMLTHIEYISKKCNMTYEQVQKKFFHRIILALILEDLIAEYKHETTDNIPYPKPHPKIIHEIITRCNTENYFNAPKYITSNILNIKHHLFLREHGYSKIKISLDTILFTPQDSNTIVCNITEELQIPEKYQRYFILDEARSFISSLTFTIDAESQKNDISYKNISFELSTPINLKKYTIKTCYRNLGKKSKNHAVLSEIDIYNSRIHFLYDFPDLHSSNFLSLYNDNTIQYSDEILELRNTRNSGSFYHR